MKRTAVIVLSLLMLVLGSAAVYRFSRNVSTVSASSSDTAELLALALPDLSQKIQPLNQWRGKVLVVNFWATWCGPCRKEMPAFGRLSDQFAAKGVQFVGISIDEQAKVQAFQQKMNVPYPLLIAGQEALVLTKKFGNATQGLPFTLVLDQTGQIRRGQIGVFDEKNLESLLASLVEIGSKTAAN